MYPLFDISFAKPVMKWAGGKTQILETIGRMLPKEMIENKINRYIEPFVGGGAVFFYIADRYPSIELIISDVNPELILLYRAIQNNVEELIIILDELSKYYLQKNEEDRQIFFYEIRKEFNQMLANTNFSEYQTSWPKRASQIIFLNRTCFNGLFRVNTKGHFNVPFGRYKNPKICDAENLRAVARLFQRTTILNEDFEKVEPFVNSETFVYFDPPYRPISETASFNSYAKNSFDNKDQLRLAKFYRDLDNKRAKIMLSNSDPKNINPVDNFFDDAYRGYRIERINAARIINSKAEKRGPIKELLIMNYEK
jgi:DNA adenine methylase